MLTWFIVTIHAACHCRIAFGTTAVTGGVLPQRQPLIMRVWLWGTLKSISKNIRSTEGKDCPWQSFGVGMAPFHGGQIETI